MAPLSSSEISKPHRLILPLGLRVLVQVVKTLSERLRRANQMLSSVDMLADWLAGSMV